MNPTTRHKHLAFCLMAAKIFVLVFCMLTIAACHRSRTVTKTETPPIRQQQVASVPKVDVQVGALLKHLKSNELVFNELSIKLKTKVTSPELSQSFTTNIRWKKNEKIWMSMSIIGIEGARVLITKDSIKIMDKINNRYTLKPLSYISQKALVNLSFSDIEHLILGQLIFMDTANAKYADNPNNITVSSNGVRFLTNILFDKDTKNPTSISVTDKMYAQTVEVQYANYQMQLGKLFPMDRELNIKKGVDFFEMIAKIQSLEVKQNLDYPFYINPSFTIE